MMTYLVGTFDINRVGNNKVEMTNIKTIKLKQQGLYDNVTISDSIEELINYLIEVEGTTTAVYFHNLAISGNFILNYLKECKDCTEGRKNGGLKKKQELKSHEYTYTVSFRGDWYSVSVRFGKKIITFFDSEKLLPFSIDEIKSGFKCISDEPVLILHKALNELHSRGFNSTTIGNCCMKEFKKTCIFDDYDWNVWLPDLNKLPCPVEGFSNADEYIRKAYHGGWCYINPKKQNKLIKGGITADVNSLYSAMMHSDSGNKFPIGKPCWFKGDVPENVKGNDRYYYFIRFKCQFNIKPKHLPTVQIKGSAYYTPTEWLTTSNYRGHEYIIDMDNKMVLIQPEFVMTMTDFELFKEHYNLKNLEILDGCYFMCDTGLFDSYINRWAKLKIESTNKVDRTISKLMLNNLSGKFATEGTTAYKVFEKTEEGIVGVDKVQASNKPGYVPIAAAITSYARNWTIRAAQKNYDTFIYADTDSLHLQGTEAKSIEIHPTKLGAWKIESLWDQGLFIRQKTYCEHDENGYNFKCAGLVERAKAILEEQLNSGEVKLRDIKPGYKFTRNTKMVSMDGGVSFEETEYTI